jgi:hypothetical protein
MSETQESLLPCRRGHSSKITKERKMIVFGGIKGFNKFTNDLVEINLQVSVKS